MRRSHSQNLRRVDQRERTSGRARGRLWRSAYASPARTNDYYYMDILYMYIIFLLSARETAGSRGLSSGLRAARRVLRAVRRGSPTEKNRRGGTHNRLGRRACYPIAGLVLTEPQSARHCLLLSHSAILLPLPTGCSACLSVAASLASVPR